MTEMNLTWRGKLSTHARVAADSGRGRAPLATNAIATGGDVGAHPRPGPDAQPARLERLAVETRPRTRLPVLRRVLDRRADPPRRHDLPAHAPPRRVDVPPVVVELVRGHAGLAVEEGEDLVGVRIRGLGGGDSHGAD